MPPPSKRLRDPPPPYSVLDLPRLISVFDAANYEYRQYHIDDFYRRLHKEKVRRGKSAEETKREQRG